MQVKNKLHKFKILLVPFRGVVLNQRLKSLFFISFLPFMVLEDFDNSFTTKDPDDLGDSIRIHTEGTVKMLIFVTRADHPLST